MLNKNFTDGGTAVRFFSLGKVYTVRRDSEIRSHYRKREVMDFDC